MTTDVVLDELEVAREIAAGNLPSPQRLGDMSLYAMRVSGTGVSYRRGIDEYVWRDPAIYLSKSMIDRCAGLPVIWEHPEKSMLTSDEFANRVVGTVMFAYPKKDELWGITRIYDREAIEMMAEDQLSTSPAVVFKDPTVNTKIEMADGKLMLIEGKPSLLDHLAVCAKGVWDKGGEPTGIEVKADSEMSLMEANLRAIHALSQMPGSGYATTNNATIQANMNFPPGSVPQELAQRADECGEVRRADMAEEKKVDAEKEEKEMKKEDSAKADAAKADAAKTDADAGTKIDKILECLDGINSRFDSLSSRMDAYESKKDAKKDEEEEKGESAKIPFSEGKKKDAEEDEKEEKEKGEPKKVAADKKKDGAEAASVMTDKKKKDADEKEEKEEEKKDAARMDSANEHQLKELQKQIDALKASAPRQFTDADRDEISAAQARADEVYSAFGDSAPRPMQNELPLEYRRRIAIKLSTHSPSFKDADVRAIAMVPEAFKIAEDQIYKDAWSAATTPDDIDGFGGLREVRRTDPTTGHRIREYYGHPMSWMSQFTGGRRLARFNLGKVRGDR